MILKRTWRINIGLIPIGIFSYGEFIHGSSVLCPITCCWPTLGDSCLLTSNPQRKECTCPSFISFLPPPPPFGLFFEIVSLCRPPGCYGVCCVDKFSLYSKLTSSSQLSSCLSLPTARINSVCHHVQGILKHAQTCFLGKSSQHWQSLI